MTELKNRENWQATHDLLVEMRDKGRTNALIMSTYFTLTGDDGEEFFSPGEEFFSPVNAQCMLDRINLELDHRPEPVTIRDLLDANAFNNEQENVCGTAACLCGWAHLQAIDKGEADPTDSPFDAGIRWFGLDPNTSGDYRKGTFIAHGKWALPKPLGQITIDDAIEYLAKVLATGEIEVCIDDAPFRN